MSGYEPKEEPNAKKNCIRYYELCIFLQGNGKGLKEMNLKIHNKKDT